MGCDWQTTRCRTKHCSCPTARQGEMYFCWNRTRIIWQNNYTRQTNNARACVYIPLFPSRLWLTLLELQPGYSRNNYASHKFRDVHPKRLIFNLVDVLMLKWIKIQDPCAYSKMPNATRRAKNNCKSCIRADCPSYDPCCTFLFYITCRISFQGVIYLMCCQLYVTNWHTTNWQITKELLPDWCGITLIVRYATDKFNITKI